MTDALQWLWIEGLTPLFGAGLLYLALGACMKIAGNQNKFVWSEAADSMGWLYAAMIIAIQSAVRFLGAAKPNVAFGAGAIVAAILCCLLLIVAMLQRSAGSWDPPARMKSLALVLAAVVLALGYAARAVR
jgi:hypothetical protein